MKIYKILLVIIAVVFFNINSKNLFSQGQTITEDEKARISTFLQIYPEVFDLAIISPEATAISDIITKAFLSYYIVPPIPFDKVSNPMEKEELQRLVDNLNFLLTTPPTWEQLYNLQMVKYSAPPTPPVYAGDEAAQRFYNSYTGGNTKKHLYFNENIKLIEQTISIEPDASRDAPKKE